MTRTLLLAPVILGLCGAAYAEDVKDAKKSDVAVATEKTAAEKLLANPNDVAALRDYANSVMRAVAQTMGSDPDGALKLLDELETTAAQLKPETPAAKSIVASMKRVASSYRNHISVLKSPFAGLAETIGELQRTYRSDPVAAAAKLDALKAELTKAKDGPEAAKYAEALESLTASLTAAERSITAAKKLTELIGQDAAALKVETWVNGGPLTDADLKGKVVFLDFWAVWCGPCIATFPHLKEWNEKYGDKGLVMIGLTRYYNYKWDDATNRAVRVDETSEGKVSPADEQAMLVKFAESHGLKHRFAIQPDSTISDYYGVTGIPHVVVIDQQGKIRLMKVGSGEENAKAIGDMLDKLLGTATTGGE